jgi:hypothetical protein
MGIENRFVADLFARFLPWIDHDQKLLFCHDDGGVGEHSTPDLCFSFEGVISQLRIECKIIKTVTRPQRDRFSIYRKQMLTWRQSSESSPHIWVAKHYPDERYYYWEHRDATFSGVLEAASAGIEQGNDLSRLIDLPSQLSNQNLSFGLLVLEILKYAANNRFLR